VRCLCRWSGWGVDPVVALHLRNAADYRLPPFGPHGTKLGHSWYQWIIKVIFLAGSTILKKVRCLGIVGGCRWMWGWSRGCTPPKEHCRVPPTYFLTTWHQTRAFLISLNNKKGFSGWFDNSKKGEVSGQIEWMGGWSRCCTPPKECCRLQPTFFWTTWHQTRPFLISVNNKSDFPGWFDNSEIGDVSGQIEWMGGWSRGCTPPQEHCILPPTYFWATWHQTRAFLISLNNKKWFSGWFDNSKKGEVSAQIEWMGGWSRGCTPPKECCRLLPTYFWTTWYQTRAFLISVNNKKWFFFLVWQF
jgi:hypothetical protein